LLFGIGQCIGPLLAGALSDPPSGVGLGLLRHITVTGEPSRAGKGSAVDLLLTSGASRHTDLPSVSRDRRCASKGAWRGELLFLAVLFRMRAARVFAMFASVRGVAMGCVGAMSSLLTKMEGSPWATLPFSDNASRPIALPSPVSLSCAIALACRQGEF
jgi:hypothetical protein